METKEFKFENAIIEFESTKGDVMVNATQMAKIYGRDVYQFLRTDGTENFIKAFCQTADLRFENEFSPDGKLIKEVKGGTNPGTWMNRRVVCSFYST